MKHVISHQRGRPKKKESERKENKVFARLTDETYDELIQFTTKRGITVSDFVRTCIEEMLDRENDKARYGYDDY